MSQFLSMIPSQQMRLEQRLTPQLIQSMEILQLPLLALEARVREELETNPVLEELDHAPERPDASEPKEDAASTQEQQAEAESFDRLDAMSSDLELDPGDLAYGREKYDGERDAKLDAMANTASRGESLKENLQHQWSLVETEDVVKQAGELLIDWMDEDGYLRSEVEHQPRSDNGDHAEARPLIISRTEEETDRLMEEIAVSRTPPVDRAVLDEALDLVQTLEPIGIAARDLTECLLIQLKTKGDTDPFHTQLVQEHLVDLAKNMFPIVAKKTGRTIEEIKEALRLIGKLHHHPGLLVQADDVPRVSPDIIIDYNDDGDGYSVRLARGSSPRLQISPQYRRMLQDKSEDKTARQFIKSRVEAAAAIIDAIQYRRERLLELAKVIVERQREFFDYGPQFLNVLRMRDLAEEFGCDPSTISRTVDGKYLQSPRGIYPVRMFFTGGTTDSKGDTVSWDSIKAKVKAIIDGEDKSNPLSDDDIAKKLSETGTSIARRTVAKYRAQLNVPSARQRREY
ncbi:MAG: RNA polymerase factor sigma-54 [Phycisphaerales bacterium]|nr:RNA polymerase factor sigma-54 [Phycisphaerales bacterium]